MISETGRILRDGQSPSDLARSVEEAIRQHRCQKALEKLEIAIRHVRRLGYHSIADDVMRARETLRTLTRAEETNHEPT